VSQNYLGFT